jgi:predicted phage-related endonuclease
MIQTDYEQGSAEWFEQRIGSATASRFKDILSTPTMAAYRNYAAEVVVERLTGKRLDRFKSSAMEYGTETEELARTAYMLKTGNVVNEVGFIKHETMLAGASPDGLIGEDGGIEIKCPNVATHIDTLKAGRMPAHHMGQVQGGMWITSRSWWDFVSFCPELNESAQIFIERIYRDDTYIHNLSKKVDEFLSSVEADTEFIRNYDNSAATKTTAVTADLFN